MCCSHLIGSHSQWLNDFSVRSSAIFNGSCRMQLAGLFLIYHLKYRWHFKLKSSVYSFRPSGYYPAQIDLFSVLTAEGPFPLLHRSMSVHPILQLLLVHNKILSSQYKLIVNLMVTIKWLHFLRLFLSPSHSDSRIV